MLGRAPSLNLPLLLLQTLQNPSFSRYPFSSANGLAPANSPRPRSPSLLASPFPLIWEARGSRFRWDDNAPNVFHALELWGFDKSAHHFTNFVHDNFGGVRLFTSPGWDGDKLIWMGDALANPPGANQRFVIERKSSKEFVITWQVRKPQADWVTGDSLTCRQ